MSEFERHWRETFARPNAVAHPVLCLDGDHGVLVFDANGMRMFSTRPTRNGGSYGLLSAAEANAQAQSAGDL